MSRRGWAQATTGASDRWCRRPLSPRPLLWWLAGPSVLVAVIVAVVSGSAGRRPGDQRASTRRQRRRRACKTVAAVFDRRGYGRSRRSGAPRSFRRRRPGAGPQDGRVRHDPRRRPVAAHRGGAGDFPASTASTTSTDARPLTRAPSRSTSSRSLIRDGDQLAGAEFRATADTASDALPLAMGARHVLRGRARRRIPVTTAPPARATADVADLLFGAEVPNDDWMDVFLAITSHYMPGRGPALLRWRQPRSSCSQTGWARGAPRPTPGSRESVEHTVAGADRPPDVDAAGRPAPSGAASDAARCRHVHPDTPRLRRPVDVPTAAVILGDPDGRRAAGRRRSSGGVARARPTRRIRTLVLGAASSVTATSAVASRSGWRGPCFAWPTPARRWDLVCNAGAGARRRCRCRPRGGRATSSTTPRATRWAFALQLGAGRDARVAGVEAELWPICGARRGPPAARTDDRLAQPFVSSSSR